MSKGISYSYTLETREMKTHVPRSGWLVTSLPGHLTGSSNHQEEGQLDARIQDGVLAHPVVSLASPCGATPLPYAVETRPITERKGGSKPAPARNMATVERCRAQVFRQRVVSCKLCFLLSRAP